MSDLVGSNLGQYQIVELVGQGGMAQVYKAWQPSLQRYVALKVLAPRLASDASFVTRFHREAVSAANLKQTHIVIIHDVGTEEGLHYIAMEYIDGTSLDELIRSQGALPPEQVVDITTQVGSALDYAHQQGFIHRDIKPANVLVDRTGLVVLTDFGIVKALSGSGMTMSLTQSDSVFGTPHYMSPEQVKDETLDHRSDLYSLGIVCYEMLAGQVPFNGTTTHSVLFAQAHETPTPLRELNPALPSSVEKVVNKMLSKEPQARYNSAGEFATALSRASTGAGPRGIEEEPAVASRKESKPSAGTPQRRHTPARRSRWSRVLLGVAVIGAVLALGALVAAVVVLDGGESTEKTMPVTPAALEADTEPEATQLSDQALTEEPDEAETLDDLLAAANNHATSGDYDGAISTYESVLDKDPDNVAALKGIGEVYEAQEDWAQAADWYEKWTQVMPDDAAARLQLGWAFFKSRDFELAVAEFSRVVTLKPDWYEGWKGYAESQYSLNQCTHALESLAQWKKREPHLQRPRRLLGRCYLRLERFDDAIVEFQALTELDPQYPDGYEGLGDAYYRSKVYADALTAYQAWAGLDPSATHAREMIGWAALRSGEYALAIEAFEEALSLEEREGPYYGLGQAYEAAGNRVKALDSYLSSIEIDPEQPEAYWRIGRIYREQAKLEAAVDAYEKSIELGTKATQAFRGLGFTYRDLGEHEKALIGFKRWADIEPTNPDAHNMVGQSHFALRDFPAAISAFSRAVELDENSSLYYKIGESYRHMKDCDQAKLYYVKALNLDPHSQNAERGLEKCQE